MDAVLESLRYPVGRFDRSDRSESRASLIDAVAALPATFRAAVSNLSDAQLDTPYREGGWTVRQVAHHVPDSHLNAYIRFKWTLTEDAPRIKTYEEALWARLPDTFGTPVSVSLALLDALHERWVVLLRAMQPADFERKLEHPEWGLIDLDLMLRLYAWHGRHHTAHVTRLRERMGW